MWPSGTSLLDTAMVGNTLVTVDDHSLNHRQLGSLANQIGSVFGTTPGTNLLANVKNASDTLFAQNSGGTANQILNAGTMNNMTFGSQTSTGGTFNAGIFGTPTLQAPTLNGVGTNSGTVINGAYNNPTLGTPVFNVWNGWVNANETWSMLGTASQMGTLQVAATASQKYDKGDRLTFIQGGTTMYAAVYAIPSGTTLLVTGGADYVFGTAAITVPKYSKAVNPNGYPGWFNYTTTWAGFSINPTGTFRFNIIGNTCTIGFTDAAGGTSNATNFTFTVPVNTLQSKAVLTMCFVSDNGTNQTTPGHISCTAASNLIGVYKTFYAGAWTNSGGKAMYFGNFTYEF